MIAQVSCTKQKRPTNLRCVETPSIVDPSQDNLAEVLKIEEIMEPEAAPSLPVRTSGLTSKKPKKTKSESVEVIEDVPGSHQPLLDAPRRDHIRSMEVLQEEGSSEELETKEAHEVELKRLKRAYERQLRHMKEEREDCLDTLREDYEERIQQLKDECRDKLELMKDECDAKLEEVNADGKKKKLELKKVQLRYQKKLELKKAEQKALEEKLKTTSFELKQTQSHLKKTKRNYEDKLEIARSDYAAGINGEGRTEHQARCSLNTAAACFQETRRQ